MTPRFQPPTSLGEPPQTLSMNVTKKLSVFSNFLASKASSAASRATGLVASIRDSGVPKIAHYPKEKVVLQVFECGLANVVASRAFCDGLTAGTLDQKTTLPDETSAREYSNGSYELWSFPGSYLRRPVTVWRVMFVFALSDCPRRNKLVAVPGSKVRYNVPMAETLVPVIEIGRFLCERVAMSAMVQLIGTLGFGCWVEPAFPLQAILDRFVHDHPQHAKLDPAPMRLHPGDHIFCVRWVLGNHSLYIQHHGIFDTCGPDASPSAIHFFSSGAGDTLGMIFEANPREEADDRCDHEDQDCRFQGHFDRLIPVGQRALRDAKDSRAGHRCSQGSTRSQALSFTGLLRSCSMQLRARCNTFRIRVCILPPDRQKQPPGILCRSTSLNNSTSMWLFAVGQVRRKTKRNMATKFEFPSYYNLPPFFSVQPILNTRKKQSQLWGDLILSWCRHHKIFELNVADASATPLFHNASINRRLPPEGIVTFIDDLVAAGSAEWVNREKTKCSILWKNIDHWATAIFKWVVDSGKTGTVLTVWEIQNGDDSKDQEFFGLDTRILLKALQALEKQGKAQVFSGTSEENLGVKFFST